ncbi:Kynurenine 3-monooxygenase [Geodia barretti]|uniref:Kynurenine 3-monooxygenase n=1 Tax=Geodia barretti TaxID=519541 RepID=A0AA35T7S9_GEOBA|nr:Kynurenine 3-monooxygenase [Geodia barretti]
MGGGLVVHCCVSLGQRGLRVHLHESRSDIRRAAGGMNAGFEDCLVLTECLTESGGELAAAAQLYQDNHWSDTHAICDLSMYNYIEMRSHVTSPLFLIKKRIDNALHYLFPSLFILSIQWWPSHVSPTVVWWRDTTFNRRSSDEGCGDCPLPLWGYWAT